MTEHPEPAQEIDVAPAKPEPNVPWEEPRGPGEVLGSALGCLGHGCGNSAIALAVIVVVAVVALVLS